METPKAFMKRLIREGIDGIDIDYYHDYAEPGYSLEEGQLGIVAANWNPKSWSDVWGGTATRHDKLMPRIAEIAEYAGYEIEWSDEWSSCHECNRAVRVSPDSYGWRRSYAFMNDCEFLCAGCLREDPTDYIQELLGSDNRALTFDLDLSQHGFKKLKNEYENGFYPGQNDDPKKIAKKLRDNGIHGYLFEVDSVGQFDLYFSVWVEEADWEKTGEVLK